MEQAVFIVGAIIFGLILILSMMYAKKKAEERRVAMFELAGRLGLQFMPYGLSREESGSGFFEQMLGFGVSSADRFLDGLDGFEPFGKGYGRDVSSLLIGRREGVDWFIFDYEYKEDTRRDDKVETTTYRFGVAAVRIPMMLPGLRMSPETFADRVMEKLGRHEIEFESAEFNKRYFVQCNDRRAAYDLIHPRMMEYLLTVPARDWQIAGPFIILHQRSYYEPMDIYRIVSDVEGFVQRIPNYVKQDRGISTPWASPFDNMS
ncbi:MAG: hypothetical protein KF784_01655 [Fimbriimonadaceae bacterium]|nr:hypothetical protein [Fimbriimonadaceae bacterium]